MPGYMKRALISTFRKSRSKVHVKLPLISMFERFWVLPASSKSWNYQSIAFSSLWCWKCYLTHSIMQKNGRQSIIQQNNVGGIASGNWTGHQNITQWDKEFNDGVGWRLQTLNVVYSHICQCNPSNQSIGQYSVSLVNLQLALCKPATKIIKWVIWFCPKISQSVCYIHSNKLINTAHFKGH